jgi:hypothetical protein
LRETFREWEDGTECGIFFVAKNQRLTMKVYLLFFFTYTLMQVFFTGFYLLVVQRVDMTLLTGTAIYLFGMYRGFQGYRYSRYKQKRKELLDSLPS